MSEKYETSGGIPTIGLTYARLHERLIGCQEDCAMISHLVRAQGTSAKDNALARYALEGLPSKVLAREYRLALPEEKRLAKELETTRKQLEARR